MFEITPNEALAIQAKQIAFYAKTYPQFANVANDLDGLEMDKPYKSHELALRIPRGAFLGFQFGVNL